MSKCTNCFFHRTGYLYNSCGYFETEYYTEPDICSAFSEDGNLSTEIENQIAIDTDNAFGKRMKCGTCKHFIGGGDWNLCCDLRHEGYPFGFLCYKDTDACDKYETQNVESNFPNHTGGDYPN